MSRIHRFRDAKPDVVVGSGHFNDSVLVVKTAKSLNFSPSAILMTVGPSNPQFAKEMGADCVLRANQVDVVQEILNATEGRGVDISIESAWVTETANQCTEVAKLGGHIVTGHVDGVGTVKGIWVDRSEPQAGYLQVATSAGGRAPLSSDRERRKPESLQRLAAP